MDVLKANYEKEVEKLKTMMPDDNQSNSQDAAVVDNGLLLCLLITDFIERDTGGIELVVNSIIVLHNLL